MASQRKSAAELQLTSFDRTVLVFNNIVLFFFLLLFVLPILNVIANSLSGRQAVMSGQVLFWPIDFTLEIYADVLSTPEVLTGYYNSGFYAVVGTLINISITICAGYALSIRDLKGKKLITFLFTFTMFFNGGLIPTFLVVRNLGIIDTRLAMLIPQAMNVFYVIMARTYFQSTIPQELHDCSALDGANDFQVVRHVVLPLSKPIIAVLTLYYAVDHWNRFFDALLYLTRQELFPLQLVIREFVFAPIDNIETEGRDAFNELARREVLKYGLIVMGSLPVIMLYPLIQKYFTKGIMIGSLKG